MRERELWSVSVGWAGDRIVLYAYEDWRGSSPPKNLARVRADGEHAWAIAPPHTSADAWVCAEFNSAGRVEANSWSGYRVTIDSDSGTEIRRVFTK